MKAYTCANLEHGHFQKVIFEPWHHPRSQRCEYGQTFLLTCCSRDHFCHDIIMNSDEWFQRRRFLKFFLVMISHVLDFAIFLESPSNHFFQIVFNSDQWLRRRLKFLI